LRPGIEFQLQGPIVLPRDVQASGHAREAADAERLAGVRLACSRRSPSPRWRGALGVDRHAGDVALGGVSIRQRQSSFTIDTQ
jgi:hypothetical protein